MTGWIQKIIDNITGLFSTQIYFGITVAPSTSVTINSNVLCIGNINIGAGGALVINGNVHCSGSYIDDASGGVAGFNGNVTIAQGLTHNGGTITVYGNLQIGKELSQVSGGMTVFGNLQVAEELTISGGTYFDVFGDCSSWTFTAAVDGISIVIDGNCSVATTFSLGGGTSGITTVSGNLTVAGNVTLSSGASVTVSGYAYLFGTITNSGTLTYHGVYPETAVNISAVSTGATDVINLAAVSGYHYTVNKLRLKCADPGANTVTVTLQELINGVLTVVDSFIIIGSLGVNPNYQNYFSLMDMFGLPELFGDQLEVSVESSAGTYTVTGSYSYRSE